MNLADLTAEMGATELWNQIPFSYPKWKARIKNRIRVRERQHWATELQIPLDDVNTIPSSTGIVNHGNGLHAHHAFWFRYDAVAHYLRHPESFGHFYKGCPMCGYPRDSPLHWLECTGSQLEASDAARLATSQAKITRAEQIALSHAKGGVPASEKADCAIPGAPRRLLTITGRRVHLSYSCATDLQQHMARIRRIRTKYLVRHLEAHPQPTPPPRPAKHRLSVEERDKLVLEWYNETDNDKWTAKRAALVTAWSRPTIDRWVSDLISREVITDSYGTSKRARVSLETPIVTRIREIYAEPDVKARWKLIRLLLDKKYATKNKVDYWSRSHVDRIIRLLKTENGKKFPTLSKLAGVKNNLKPTIPEKPP